MPPYTYYGMRGTGKPIMMPQQKTAVMDRINSLAGVGIEQGFRDRESDPANNLSPTEQAGTTISRPRMAQAAPNMPNLLSTTPNMNGLAMTAKTPPTFTPNGEGQPIDFNQLPSGSAERLLNRPNLIPRRTALEGVAQAPSQVDLLRQYKEQMGQLEDPYKVAQQETANRGTGGKILDAVLGGLAGLGQGGLLGAIGGGVGGYRGVPRQQAIMDRVTKQNALKRQGIMDQYGIDKAILDQGNIESDDFQKRQDLAFKQDKEYNDQEQARIANERQTKLDELKIQADADKAAVDRGQLTINQYNARRQMLEFKLQMLEKLYPGQILEQGDQDLGLKPGFQVPTRPQDRPGVAYTIPDKEGKVYQFDPKNPASAPKEIDTGKIPGQQSRPNIAIEQAKARDRVYQEMLQKYPNGKIPNPNYDLNNPDVQMMIAAGKIKDAYTSIEDSPEFKAKYNQYLSQVGTTPQATTSKPQRQHTPQDIETYKKNRSNKQYRQAFINKFGVDPETLLGR